MVPYRLEEGIWFENIDTLLPWNARLEDLKQIGSPEVRIEPDRTVLHWRKQRWLDGLDCTISATFYHNSATHLSHNSRNGLQLVNYHLYLPSEEKTRETYVRIKEALARRLGKPTADYAAYRYGLPLAEWDFEHVLVVLMVFERFGEYLVGEVWHKPLPQWRADN